MFKLKIYNRFTGNSWTLDKAFETRMEAIKCIERLTLSMTDSQLFEIDFAITIW